MSKKLYLSLLVVLAAVLPMLAGPRTTEAITVNQMPVITLSCTGWTVVSDGSYITDRDTSGTGRETTVIEARDGDGTLLRMEPLNLAIGMRMGFNVGFFGEYDLASPSSNPITMYLISPAGNEYLEQSFVLATGNCEDLAPADGEAEEDTEPVPGCDTMIPIPASAVGGVFTLNSELYWEPGKMTSPPIIMEAGKAVRVIGLDASGQYYKVLFACTFAWARVDTLAPNFDSPWNGLPLPTVIVE